MSRIATHQFEGSYVLAAAATTYDIYEKECRYEWETLTFNVKNTASGDALDAFSISMKMHEDAAWVVVKSSGFATASNIVPFASVDVATLAANTEAIVVVNLYRCYAVKISASSAGTNTTVTFKGAFHGEEPDRVV